MGRRRSPNTSAPARCNTKPFNRLAISLETTSCRCPTRARLCAPKSATHRTCDAAQSWDGDRITACVRDTFQQAQENCKARGGDLCRGNAVSTSMDDPSCPGGKTDYVWTLTKCDVNGVAGRVIRPSAGGAPGPLCETNTLALHQSRCCSNVC